MPRYFRRSLVLALAAALIVVVGCGPKKGVPISGKVVLPAGMALKEGGDVIQIIFVPEKSSEQSPAANLKPDATFRVESPGVIPGQKYKVAFSLQPYPGSKVNQNTVSVFNSNFGREGSPLTYEAAAGEEQSITVDLAKKTVTKN